MVIPFVALAAVLVRLLPLLLGDGLLSWGRYDDGVYYAASAALLDGRVPYRDFVLLHPPLIALVLLPFALLGRLASDPIGLVAARLAWMALGALAAVLAARFAGRWGVLPALVAGLWVACSAETSYASQSTFIEPVADLALLGALVMLSCDRERPRHELVAGLLLGIALTGKIWYVAPVGVLLLVLLLSRPRSALRAAGVAAATACAILLPFFALAPRQMWHMVVYDQLTRRVAARESFLNRLGIAVGGRFLHLPSHLPTLVAGVAAVAVLVGIAACLRHRPTRPVAAVALTTLVVLVASPSIFRHYGSFSAAPVGVSLGVGWALIGRHLRSTAVRRGLALACLAAILAGGGVLIAHPDHRRFPRQDVEAVLPSSGCVTSDNPVTLEITDHLSSDLRAGCALPVDVTGESYGVRVPRRKDVAYLTWLQAYLRSGSAVILARHAGDGLEQRAIGSLGTPVFHHGAVTVIRPDPSRTPPAG